jgi:hypothetical protein
MLIKSAQTILCPWSEADGPAFAALHADAEVMKDISGPLTRSESDEKLTRYRAAFAKHGSPAGRWKISPAFSSAIPV